jgi:hypothetical protein
MKLLVKNHQKENEPKEPVMPGKEEAKSPSVMKKYKKIRWAQRKDICDCEWTMHPGYEEQQYETYSLRFFAGVDTKRYGKLILPKDGRECRDNVVTLHERQGSSYEIWR